MIVCGVNKIPRITLDDEARARASASAADTLRIGSRVRCVGVMKLHRLARIQLSAANVSRLNFRCRIERRIDNRYPSGGWIPICSERAVDLSARGFANYSRSTRQLSRFLGAYSVSLHDVVSVIYE